VIARPANTRRVRAAARDVRKIHHCTAGNLTMIGAEPSKDGGARIKYLRNFPEGHRHRELIRVNAWSDLPIAAQLL
jgi:hypothetical protein